MQDVQLSYNSAGFVPGAEICFTTCVPAPSSTAQQNAAEDCTSVAHRFGSTVTALAPLSTSSTSLHADSKHVSTAEGLSYQDVILFHHNRHRQNHSAPKLTWDDALERTAAEVAQTCDWAHVIHGYGQNIAAGVPAENISQVVTGSWYNSEVDAFSQNYGLADPPDGNWAHFTQVVWKNTTHIGCSTQDCSAKGIQGLNKDISPHFTVCNYRDTGNIGSAFAANVGRPLMLPPIFPNTTIH